jgi:hypothetical protein
MSWCLDHAALEGLQPNEFQSDIRRGKFFVTIGKAACESCNATWNLGTNSAFALGPRKTEIEVELTLRLTVGQSVCLGVGHPFGAYDQILLFPFFCRKIALLFALARPL